MTYRPSGKHELAVRIAAEACAELGEKFQCVRVHHADDGVPGFLIFVQGLTPIVWRPFWLTQATEPVPA